MPQTPWNIPRNQKQYNISNSALLSDEQALKTYQQDFGRMITARPAAVFIPRQIDELSSFIHYANQHQLPLTIRTKGLSQGGQALSVDGGINLSMEAFKHTEKPQQQCIWADANASFADVLKQSLPEGLAPFALPYNCNLSIAGVLSAGGLGASAFNQGTITTQVEALEVVIGSGEQKIVCDGDPLFDACLGGQGRVAVITRAKLKLKPVKAQVNSYYLVYNDVHQWLEDIEKAREQADFLELFCSSSTQGAGLFPEGRRMLSEWLYGMHISFNSTENNELPVDLNPWKMLHQQQEPIESYYFRHDGRFEMMRRTGQWSMLHPWYECFIPEQLLRNELEQILANMPAHLVNWVHVVPIANRRTGFTMFPETEKVYELMVLHPGLPDSLRADARELNCKLDELLLSSGGKRYLSGYLGDEPPSLQYWQQHYGSALGHWQDLKKRYDPGHVFQSHLFQGLK